MKLNGKYSKDKIDKYSSYSHALLTGRILKITRKKYFLYVMYYNTTHSHYGINRPSIGSSSLYCDYMAGGIFNKNFPMAIAFLEVI